MSAEAAAGGLPQRTRPNTRASIKALNFSSMGKALADVMHKESKEGAAEKEKVKKTRDSTISKRSSLVPPASSSADKISAGKKGKTTPVESGTTTRGTRRLSTLPRAGGTTSSEEQSPASSTVRTRRTSTRASTLRPRPSLASSALPKYRPKSALVENTSGQRDPSPPARAGTRRRLSTSEEEKDTKGKSLLFDFPTTEEKTGRAISPLPHRNALQVNLTSAINVRPATPEKKDKKASRTSSPLQSSPTRVPSPARNKLTKTAKPAAPAPTITRPPSSSSSSSSPGSAPSTPKRTVGRTGNTMRQAPSPLRTSITAPPDSPLSGASSLRRSQNATPNASRMQKRTSTQPPIILTAESSMDSMDASDVEYMLRDVASPSAPTPVLPRLRNADVTIDNPHTPPRLAPYGLPGRTNLSYLSPALQGAESSPFLRPQMRGMGAERGSILSWEALAQHNKLMGTPDVEHMLAEVDAPFHTLMASPTPSNLTLLTDIPESPALSALPSPSGYGSISQVLLPDVTPSPAPQLAALRFDEAAASSPVDSAASTMLRLQLASMENAVQEKESEVASLQAQLASAAEARLRDTEELARQISVLEEQIQTRLPNKAEEKWSRYAASLEEQLTQAHLARDKAVADAQRQASLDAVASQTAALRRQQTKMDVVNAACGARTAWKAVECTAESELEMVRSSREMLAVLLAGLDRHL